MRNPMVLAIHGGATQSTAIVATVEGAFVSEHPLPPLALGVSPDLPSTFSRLAASLARSSPNQSGPFAAVCCAFSGMFHPVYRQQLITALETSRLASGTAGHNVIIIEDVWAELLASNECRGLVCFVSSGVNIALGGFVNGLLDETFSIGRWGSDLSDLGSGYYVGRLALVALLDDLDGRLSVTKTFRQEILRSIGLSRADQVPHWFTSIRATTLWRSVVSSLARTVVELSDKRKDCCATALLWKGARQLEKTLQVAIGRSLCLWSDASCALPILLTGNLLRNCRLYLAHLESAILGVNDRVKATSDRSIQCKIVTSSYSPIVGAIRLALWNARKAIDLDPELNDLDPWVNRFRLPACSAYMELGDVNGTFGSN